jgi:mannose-6-phosphate isomerase-like protein (cupin superfamily)
VHVTVNKHSGLIKYIHSTLTNTIPATLVDSSCHSSQLQCVQTDKKRNFGQTLRRFLPMSLIVVSVLILVLAGWMIRMVPEPVRTSHTMFGEYFTVNEEHQQSFSRFKVLHSAAETGGKFYEMQEWFPKSCGEGWSAACAPPYHIHLRQNETFKVVQGQARFKVNGVESVASAGEEVLVVAGEKHHFTRGPDSDEDLIMNFKLEPALKGEMFFQEFVGLIRDSNMKPNPLLLIWLLCEHDMYLADIPTVVHAAMCFSLDLVAPLLGYRVRHEQYSGANGQ